MPYLSAYPRAGQVALLCEGDLIGYEATLFQKWTGTEFGNLPLVDIWPCGTQTSIFGVSDAIGRSRPIFVIEDRDFRSSEEARSECTKHKKDRSGREIRVIGWVSWSRNEIENYLLEPAVLLPVFCEAFACSEDNVIKALNDILPALALFQACQHARACARHTWSDSDPSALLLSGLFLKPKWKDSSRTIAAPDHETFRAGLEKNHHTWMERMQAVQCDVVAEFDERYKLWANCQWSDDFWRTDWAGKETLQWLRIALTSRFGWPNPQSGDRESLQWDMSRDKIASQDRQVEAALRPRLIDRFLEALPATLPQGIRDEFNAIKAAIDSFVRPSVQR